MSNAKAFLLTTTALLATAAYVGNETGNFAFRGIRGTSGELQEPFVFGPEAVSNHRDAERARSLDALPFAGRLAVKDLRDSIINSPSAMYCPPNDDPSLRYEMTYTITGESVNESVGSDQTPSKTVKAKALCLNIDNVVLTENNDFPALEIEVVYPIDQGDLPISLYDSFLSASPEQCAVFKQKMHRLATKLLSELEPRNNVEIKFPIHVVVAIGKDNPCDPKSASNTPR
jgi:hypothetical protein